MPYFYLKVFIILGRDHAHYCNLRITSYHELLVSLYYFYYLLDSLHDLRVSVCILIIKYLIQAELNCVNRQGFK